MTKEEVKAYQDFMWNPDNAHHCRKCPENRGDQNGLPCGQQNCWVVCHTKAQEDE